MSSITSILIKPVVVDAVNRSIIEEHDTTITEFDATW